MTNLGPDQVAAFFSKAGQVIKRMNPQDLTDLVEGSGRLVYLPPGAKIDLPMDMAELASGLNDLTSRSQSEAYFKKYKLKKADLLLLARHADISVSTKDTVATLRQKIIEGTVGAREDAAAIRSHSWSQT